MNLGEMLGRPEGKTLEFKRDLSSPGPIMKTVVAFANTAGGDLVIGVDDDTTMSLASETRWPMRSASPT